MEDRFSNIFFACCASWFKKNCFMNIFWPQQHGTELGVSANIFGNYDIAYREESCVTRSKQHNVWRRTTSIRTDLSTGRRTSTSEGEGRSTSPEPVRIGNMVRCAWRTCISMMSKHECYWILLTKDSVVHSEHFTCIKKIGPWSFADCFKQSGAYGYKV